MIPYAPNNKDDRRLAPLRTGKLNLCNYAPPTVRAASSITFPSGGSPQTSPSSPITHPTLPPTAALRPPSDEDSVSPASSTLSTPSVSPTIVPRVIIGGQPATSTYSSSEKDDDAIAPSRPGHIADWDWSAPSKPRIEGLPRQHADLVPGSERPERRFDTPSSPGRKALRESDSLYDAFVTQWCFAQGPSPSHNAYGGDGIMA